MAVECFQLSYVENQKRVQRGKYYFFSMLAAFVLFYVIIYYVETELNTVAFMPFFA